jgi:hypothetical protein
VLDVLSCVVLHSLFFLHFPLVELPASEVKGSSGLITK